MPDPRFYNRYGPFSLKELCELTGATLSDASKESMLVRDVKTLQSATSETIAIFHNKKYLEAFQASQAGACFVEESFVKKAPKGMICLITDKPYRAYAKTLAAFYPEVRPEPFISSEARIHPTAKIGSNCFIEPGVVIRANVEIGENTRIFSNAVINESVVIGKNCHIDVNVYITHTLIGNNVTIYPNSTIGKIGFGFDMDAAGYISVVVSFF